MERPTNTKENSQTITGKIISVLVLIAISALAIFGLKWAKGSSLSNQSSPATDSNEKNVSKASSCGGPLVLAHGFSAYQTNQDNTDFVEFAIKDVGELRSFSWSPNGQQLALFGNTTGSGVIYVADSGLKEFHLVPVSSELPYVMGAAWSRDGSQLVAWEVQNNSTIYLFNKDGSNFKEIKLPAQVFETPQFAPGNKSIVFYGADTSSSGLIEAKVDGSEIRMISDLVENEGSFAWSQDGSHLAYIEMDRNLGEARLIVQDIKSNSKTTIASLPIPKGSGSSLPASANLSWSSDGKALVFEFGRGNSDRAIYLASTDGSGLVKLAESAHAPAISADGKCVAYISDKQVFLLDLTVPSAHPILLANLPAGREISDFRLDKLGWRPEALSTAFHELIAAQ